MLSALVVLHVFVAIVLVIVVLLQSGKGGGLGAGMGGGSSNTLFGASGGSNFFTKLTTGLAIVFMITSLTLTAKKGRKDKTSVFDEQKPVAADQSNTAAPTNAPVASPAPTTEVAVPVAPVATDKKAAQTPAKK